MLKYRILGPLKVGDDLREVAVNAAKQRIVLGILLLNSNHFVPADRLIYELWGDVPPVTAGGTLQSLISRLKRALNSCAEPGQTPLVKHPAGYELVVAGDCLDLLALEEALARIRQARAEAGLGDAAPYIDSALKLWRGRALAGIPGTPQISAETTRLEEVRLTLLEDRANLWLAASDHAKVVSTHRTLLLEHPLRERFWAQLILALYQGGRQGDALKTFGEARDRLVAELGIEPGPELRKLQQDILRGDVDDPRQGSATTLVRSLPAPHQLPPDTSDFVGRAAERNRFGAFVDRAREKNVMALIAISGMAGVGKTAFSLHMAYRVLADFPDGQFYVDLRGAESDPLDPAEVLSRFLRAVGTVGGDVPQGLDERLAMYRSSLAGRRMLVILDNAADEGQVASLLPGSPSCLVVITSRRRLSGLPGAHHLELDVFSESEAIGLLGEIAGAQRVQQDMEAISRLALLCGYHPLSLRICGAKLAGRPHWSIGAVAQRVADKYVRLNELGYGTMSVRASFNLSYESLAPQTRRLFCLLGILDLPDFAGWVAAPLLDVTLERAEEQMELLVESRMLEVAESGGGRTRYRFHDLIHCLSRELTAETISDTERKVILNRVLGAWLTLADRAHESSFGANFLLCHGGAARWPIEERYCRELLAEPWSWWESERASLVAIICQAASEGLDEACWDLAVTSVTLFGTYGYLDDWQLTHEAALSVTRRLSNRRGEAISMSHTGGLRIFQRRYDDALDLLKGAADLLSKLGDHRAEAFAYAGMGIAERGRGDPRRALQFFHTSRERLDRRSDPLAEAHVLLHMGQTHLSLGDVSHAEDLLLRSQQIARDADSTPIEGYVSRWLGETYLAKGDHARAERSLLRSAKLISTVGDTKAEAAALQSLASMSIAMGDRERAETFLERTAAAARRMPESTRTARTLAELGALFLTHGDARRAADCLARSAEIFRSAGARRLAARSLRKLAEARSVQGEPDLATRALDRADELFAASLAP
jgi:DNA-binding SARP family transcriptional activator/tetratricopeptide (TPR) repeat protein